jgi:hypothetical protein
MDDTVELRKDKYRLFVAIQYLNASVELCKGLKRQHDVNNFHFLVTLRSFIEYTRRGIWFLIWASDEKLQSATKLSFASAGSPGLAKMDEMLNEKLGKGKKSALMANVPEMNEPFINCLHALTHGNPISVRMMAHGLEKIFDTAGLMARAEADLAIFRILLYRQIVGEDQETIWTTLAAIHSSPNELSANVKIAAHLLNQSGNTLEAFTKMFTR